MCDTRAPRSVSVHFQCANQCGVYETLNTQREREKDIYIYRDPDLDRYVTSLYILAGPVNKRPNESIDEAVCAKQ